MVVVIVVRKNTKMTTYYQLMRMCKDIPNFRGIYMRNSIPNKLLFKENAIVNLDDKNGGGTHWVAYKKHGNKITYFNSFGDLKTPKELIKYFGRKAVITYNKRRYQSFNSNKCGILCWKFLKNML